MVGVFELFHLSLISRTQGDLFYTPPSREEWLRQSFRMKFTFEHRNKEYHWVPVDTESSLITGNVARTHKRIQHTPPDEGAEEIVRDEWQGAFIILDPVHHDDGQKLSFERDGTIGKPRSVLQSMLAYVNDLPNAPYAIEPKPIFNESSFWAWAAAHEYKMRKITFDFVVPNMFGSYTELDDELKRLGSIGAQTVKVILDGPDGIDAQSQQVTDGVEYAAKGGGSVTARAKNGDRFKSTDDAQTAKLPTQSAEPGIGIRALSKWFPRLLGREQDSDVDGADGPDDHTVGD